MKKTLLGVLIIIVMILSLSFSTYAATKTDLQNQQDELNAAIKAAEEEKKKIQDQMSATMKEIQQITSGIVETESQIADLEDKMDKVQTEIDATTKELEKAEENYAKQKELLDARLVAAYKAGDTSYLDVLLNSTSLTDFISNYYLVTKIAQYDNDLLKKIEEERKRIETAKEELESKQSEFKTLKASASKTATLLKNQKTLKDTYVNELSEDEKELQAHLDSDRAALKAIEAEIKRIEANSGTVANPYTGGRMLWPVPGYTKISSYFGNRAASGVVTAWHGGIDIVGSYPGQIRGANIVAAADGQVVISQYSSSAGNYILINHGNGVYTVYMHAETLIASVGQYVTAGTVIAKVGTTGNSTGYHLHFGVRLNGTYVDPLPYLQG